MRKSNPDFDEDYMGIAEPGIWLAWSETRFSASKFGGLPGLPSPELWPRHEISGLPLHFLCQIDLASLPPTPLANAKVGVGLPRTGMLLFFADMSYQMLWQDEGGKQAATRVVYVETPGDATPAPGDLPVLNHNRFNPGDCNADGSLLLVEQWMETRAIDFYPWRYSDKPAWKEVNVRHVENVERARGVAAPVWEMSDGPIVWPNDKAEEMRKRAEWRNRCPAIFVRNNDKTAARNGVPWDANFTEHMLLGPAIDVQGEARLARKEGRVPLLQLASDRAMGRWFNFCDSGMAQFWIKPDDLAAGRFDLAWATTEGG